MSTQNPNSKESIKTASRVFAAYGGKWSAVERAAKRDKNGVYVISSKPSPKKSGKKAKAG